MEKWKNNNINNKDSTTENLRWPTDLANNYTSGSKQRTRSYTLRNFEWTVSYRFTIKTNFRRKSKVAAEMREKFVNVVVLDEDACIRSSVESVGSSEPTASVELIHSANHKPRGIGHILKITRAVNWVSKLISINNKKRFHFSNTWLISVEQQHP